MVREDESYHPGPLRGSEGHLRLARKKFSVGVKCAWVWLGTCFEVLRSFDFDYVFSCGIFEKAFEMAIRLFFLGLAVFLQGRFFFGGDGEFLCGFRGPVLGPPFYTLFKNFLNTFRRNFRRRKVLQRNILRDIKK